MLPLFAVVIGLCCGGLTAWYISAEETISYDLLASYVGIPAQWTSEVREWMSTPKQRLLHAFLPLALVVCLIVALLDFGWLKGLTLVFASIIGGAIVASRLDEHESQIGPALQRILTLVRARAQDFRAYPDPDRARAADDFAVRLEGFRQVYSSLSPAEFVVEYTAPSYVASMLESFYLPSHLVSSGSSMPPGLRDENPPRSDSDIDLPAWLEEEIRPLSSHPVEQARVRMLEGIRQELLAGGGTKYKDFVRLQQLIVLLRHWKTTSA